MESVIELNDRTRLVVTPDSVPLQVRDADVCITGCYTPPSWWGRNVEGPLPLHPFPGDLARADEKLEDLASWEPSRDVSRWAWLFHGVVLQRFGATYWWCDQTAFNTLHGGEFTREVQENIIASEHQDYERFISGEAKIVSLQRLARFRRTTRKYHDHHQDLLEVWETVESVSDQYLDAQDNEFDVAFEHFHHHLTKKELTIVTAAIDEKRG